MYASTYTYDANGNIEAVARYDQDGNLYDDFSYKYKRDSDGRLLQNRLYQLNDLADEDDLYVNEGPGGAEDIGWTDDVPFNPQDGAINTAYNYGYDKRGNLIRDDREGITAIDWTVAGQVRSVAKSTGPSLAFAYGAGGHRTLKQVGDPDLGTGYREHYIRDEQGNIMAVYRYTNSGGASTQVVERPVYGSSRLGSYVKPQEVMGPGLISVEHTMPLTAADQRYELTDHLGNVSTVVTGRLLDGAGAGSQKQAEVVLAHGYEPFGSLLPGRNYRQPLGPPPPPPETPKGTLVITEFSNGPSQANGSASGECEYVELYVTKCALYPDATEVDIRGWLIDDNAGNFNTTGGCTTGVSISSGHLRFVDHATWASVPVGTVIVVFNGADNCYNFTSNETGSGGQYFINVGSSTLIERTTTQPSTTGCDYCGAAYAAPGSSPWNTVALGNTADAIQVRCPDCPESEAGFFHGVGYGSSFGAVNAGTNDLGGAYFSGNGTERSYELTGTGCGTRGDAGGWTRYSVPAAGTPPATAGVVDAGVLAWLEECQVPCCGSFEPPAVVQKHGYRFGFQGQEKDNEIYGAEGTALSFEYRVHDARVGRFLSIDPLAAKYPFYSPYAFSGNRVIDRIELEGLEPAEIPSNQEEYIQTAKLLGEDDNRDYLWSYDEEYMMWRGHGGVASEFEANMDHIDRSWAPPSRLVTSPDNTLGNIVEMAGTAVPIIGAITSGAEIVRGNFPAPLAGVYSSQDDISKSFIDRGKREGFSSYVDAIGMVNSKERSKIGVAFISTQSALDIMNGKVHQISLQGHNIYTDNIPNTAVSVGSYEGSDREWMLVFPFNNYDRGTQTLPTSNSSVDLERVR
jgi:hypothetical protein